LFACSLQSLELIHNVVPPFSFCRWWLKWPRQLGRFIVWYPRQFTIIITLITSDWLLPSRRGRCFCRSSFVLSCRGTRLCPVEKLLNRLDYWMRSIQIFFEFRTNLNLTCVEIRGRVVECLDWRKSHCDGFTEFKLLCRHSVV